MAFKMKAGKEGPMYKNFPGAFKAKGDPTGVPVVEGSKAAKKAERKANKAERKAEREKAKEVKRVGGEERYNELEGKKAERVAKKEQYRIDKAGSTDTRRGLAEQGKGYAQEDESGKKRYVYATRGGTDAVTGAVSRETMKRREANKGKTAEQHAREAKDYFDNKRAKRTTGKKSA